MALTSLLASLRRSFGSRGQSRPPARLRRRVRLPLRLEPLEDRMVPAVLNPGDILVADISAFGGPGGVIKVDPSTGVQTTISSGGNFADPFGIALEADGKILVADLNAFGGPGAVIRVDPATGSQAVVSSGGFFNEPRGVAVESNGNILVANGNPGAVNGNVIRVNPVTGAQTILASGGNIVNPVGITVAADGSIYVNDNLGLSFPSTAELVRINPVTGAQTVAASGGNYHSPVGLTIDAAGQVVIADQVSFTGPSLGDGGSAGMVFRVNPATGAQTVISKDQGVLRPRGVAVQSSGNILVTDRASVSTPLNTLRRVNPLTGAQTILSTGGIFGEINGIVIVPAPANQSPTAMAGGPYAINEGSSLALNASASSDPDGDALTYSWDINGDGAFGDAGGVGPTVSWTQLQALGINDGPATFSVNVRVDDGHGHVVASSATSLTVQNVAPSNVTLSANPSTINEGQSTTLNGTFTDPGTADTHTVTISWGDSSANTTLSLAAGVLNFSTSHQYSENANYTISATVSDDDGGSSINNNNGKIAFASQRDGNGEIYVMNLDGTGQTRLTNNPAFDFLPAWSPDGSKIAFISNRGGDFEIYVMNADGTGQTRLTNNPALDTHPAWSPDGSKIAFYSTRDGNEEIYLMNPDGSGQTRLTNNPAADYQPTWSPDGNRIAFASNRNGNLEIYVMNADGSGPTRLTNNTGHDDEPAWSPSGTKIAFSTQRNGLRDVYVMNADGTGETRLTNDPAHDSNPAWSRDSSTIAFASDRTGDREIFVMNADGSAQVRVTNSPGFDEVPHWQPLPATIKVTVDNVAPTPTITGAPASSPEGTAISLTSTVIDPGSADAHTYAWSVTKNGAAYANGSAPSFSFTPNDNGTYVVSLTVTDDDGGSGSDSKTITVTNVAPTATLTNNGPVFEGNPVTISFSNQSDPSGADTATGFHYAYACDGGTLAGANYYCNGSA